MGEPRSQEEPSKNIGGCCHLVRGRAGIYGESSSLCPIIATGSQGVLRKGDASKNDIKQNHPIHLNLDSEQ